MAAERERLATPDMRQSGGRAPIDVPVGTDYRDTYGGPDRTRQMELYKYDRERRRPSAPAAPDADALARAVLKKAGFAAHDLDGVVPLLKAAEEHVSIEKHFNSGGPAPSTPATR